MDREQVIEDLLNTTIKKEDLVVCSLGKMGRELFELRKKRGEPNNDFYCMGAMGCTIGLALGVALHTKKRVFLLIGDGAALMKLGSFTTVLANAPRNMFILVLDNQSYESTGGQPNNFEYARDWVQNFAAIFDCEPGCRADLGRPDISPEQMVENFNDHVISQ